MHNGGVDATGPGGPARDERRPDDLLAAVRVDRLSGEIIASYRAGLTPKEIAEIFVVDLAAVQDVLATANVQPPRTRSRWLRPVRFRRRSTRD